MRATGVAVTTAKAVAVVSAAMRSLGARPLRRPHVLDVGPQVREGGGDAPLARGQVLAERVARDG